MAMNGDNNVEEAEMSECDGEKVVTMMDVLQEQQEFEEDANAVLGASDDMNCTYPKGYIKRQAIYACLTCCAEARHDDTKRAGVCLACSLNCHENHDLIELYTKRNFRCDCGNPKFNSHPCQFTPNKTELNTDNKYNQNFSGTYCICHRPYPDPEPNEEEEMIQCIICEDWLHTTHLDAAVPSNSQYAEMVCKACMEKNEFLHDYSHLAVNIEMGDIDIVNVNGNDSLCNGKADNNLSNGDITEETIDKDDDMNTDTNSATNEPENSESDNKTETTTEASLETEKGNSSEKMDIEDSETSENVNQQEIESNSESVVENTEQAVPESTESTATDPEKQPPLDNVTESIEKDNTVSESKNDSEIDSNVENTTEANEEANSEDNKIQEDASESTENEQVNPGDNASLNPDTNEAGDTTNINPATNEASDNISMNPDTNEAGDSTSMNPDTNEASDTTSMNPDTNEASDTTSMNPDTNEASDTTSMNPDTNEASDNTSMNPEEAGDNTDRNDIENKSDTGNKENEPDSTETSDVNATKKPAESHDKTSEVISETAMDTTENDINEASKDEVKITPSTNESNEKLETETAKVDTDNTESAGKDNSETEAKLESIETETKLESIETDKRDEITDPKTTSDEPNSTNNDNSLTNGSLNITSKKDEVKDTSTEVTNPPEKRKLSDEIDNSFSKKPKLDSTCLRPRNVKRIYKGATFWPAIFRQKLCTCNECIQMYKDLSVLFLTDLEDTVSAYETLGKERHDGEPSTQYEKGMKALSSLNRVQQINALTEYNKMRDKLLDFLKSFKDKKEVVKEEDIRAFFAGMKPKREPDGVYFCR